jgi:hypothetical protein
MTVDFVYGGSLFACRDQCDENLVYLAIDSSVAFCYPLCWVVDDGVIAVRRFQKIFGSRRGVQSNFYACCVCGVCRIDAGGGCDNAENDGE